MTKIDNILFFDDDNEIVEELINLPKIEEYDNMNILEFMQRRTTGANFGTVILVNEQVYVLYKFDKEHFNESDAGLLLSTSDKKYASEHINLWNSLKHGGMQFSDKIFPTLINMLTDISITNNFF